MRAHCDANVLPAPMDGLGIELEGLAELERILNIAMETVTERRYKTVDQFQHDIRLWAGVR